MKNAFHLVHNEDVKKKKSKKRKTHYCVCVFCVENMKAPIICHLVGLKNTFSREYPQWYLQFDDLFICSKVGISNFILYFFVKSQNS